MALKIRPELAAADKGSNVTAENKRFITPKPKAPRQRYWEKSRAPLSFHADGGPLDPDKVNVVGEDGPELVADNNVIPLNDSPLGSALAKDKTPSPLGNANQEQPLPKMVQEAEAAQQRDQIAQDKKQAASKNDLVGLGIANIHEKELNKAQAPTAAPDVQSVVSPSPLPNVSSLGSALRPSYGGPGKAVAPGDAIPTAQLPQDELQFKRQQLKQQMLSPDLETSGNARRQLAELDQQNPYGSEANHPGLGGKILHGLGTAANIAGDVLAPGTTALIPGTDLNRVAQENRGEEELKLGSALKSQAAATADTQSQTAQRNQQTRDLQTNRALTNSLAEKGYTLGTDQTGQPVLNEIPGWKDSPKNIQDLYANAVAGVLHKGGDPNKDPHVQQILQALQAAEKPEKIDDKETFVNQWLRDNGKPDTAGNRASALKAYATASQAPERPQQVLLMVPDGKGGNKVIEAHSGMTISGEAVKPGTGAAHFSEPVVTFDPVTKQNVVMERSSVPQGQFAYKADPAKINSTIGGFNDVQNKINELATVVNSSDMKDIQPGLVGDAVSEINHDFELSAFGSHVPLDRFNAMLDAENMKSANQATRNFLVAYMGAREAMTQLPRLQTFGQSSRMTEQQMKAAVKLLPGAESDPALAKQKIESLQRMIDPLRKQLPVMPGASLIPSFMDNQKGSTSAVSSAPKTGDTQQHLGATYKFDGKQWVKQ